MTGPQLVLLGVIVGFLLSVIRDVVNALLDKYFPEERT